MPQQEFDLSRRSEEEEEERRKKIVVEDEPLDVCTGDQSCEGGECKVGGVCVRPGTAPAPAPKNAKPPPVPFKRPGCGGCASTRSDAGHAAIGCALAAALALVWRGRRRGRRAQR